jgi:hypothetical protein
MLSRLEVIARMSRNASINNKMPNHTAIKTRINFTGRPVICSIVCVSWCEAAMLISGTKEFRYGILLKVGLKKQPSDFGWKEYSQPV